MRDLSRSAAAQIADNQHWLERQRHLETELQLAHQARRSIKRKHAAALAVASAASAAPVDDSSNDNWMMTYLDMMTLLLVVVMSMLAMASAGKQHDRAAAAQPPQIDVRQLARVDTRPAGALLLVARPAEPEPAPEPVAEPAPPQEVPPADSEVAAVPAVASEPPPPSQPTLDDLLKQLPLDRLGEGIEVVKNESTVSFRISSEILFPSGQSDLNLKGLKVLHNLVPVLNSVPHKLIVAGHTDTQDIRSARFPSNWELSSARAGSVVRYLQSNGVEGERLSAVGYADTRPLADNGTAEGRATNRRVELMLQP